MCYLCTLYVSDLHFNVFEIFCVSETETLKTMLTRQDVMSKNIQEILLRLNQIGGASQGPETPIEIDVAQSLEELAVLEAKLKDLPDYKKRLVGNGLNIKYLLYRAKYLPHY